MLSRACRSGIVRASDGSSLTVFMSTITRGFSSKSDGFKPHRPTPKSFHEAPKRKQRHKKANPPIQLNADKASMGRLAEDALKYLDRHGAQAPITETTLRAADYMTAEIGTTEDLVGERRAMMDAWSPEQAKSLKENITNFIQAEKDKAFEDKLTISPEPEEDLRGNNTQDDPNQKAFGDWSITVIKVDRVQKVQRGGTLVSYRALVVGGNLKGCAGFGIGKASAPNEATKAAERACKRNIFFIDRYNGSGLTSDLAGRHNSCRVALRSVEPNRGLHGHPLILEILKYFGISDCSAKSHGNRNVYNVVYATFKAICTHESIEDIALKRGKRLVTVQRAKRLQI